MGNKKRNIIMAVAVIILFIAIGFRIIEEQIYSEAENAMASMDYEKASKLYGKIYFFKDSKDKKQKVEKLLSEEADNSKLYNSAVELYEDKSYMEALKIFEKINKDYLETSEYIAKCEEKIDDIKSAGYKQAVKQFNNQDYYEALVQFRLLDGYMDSTQYMEKCYDGIRQKLATKFSAGSVHSVAIGEKNLYYTGSKKFGQDDLPADGLMSVSAGGYFTAGIYEDGKARIAGEIPWYNNNYEEYYDDILQVSAGYDFVAFLKESGEVCLVGYNEKNVIECENWSNIVQIDVGCHLLAAIDDNGEVYVSGKGSSEINEDIQRNKEEWKEIVQIVAGGTADRNGFIVALRDDGKILTAGDIENGICEAEKWSEKNIKKISAGDYHVVAIDYNGNVYAVMNYISGMDNWDDQACCNFDDWSDEKIIDIEAGNGTTLGENGNYEILSTGYDHQEQVPQNKEWIIKH